MRLISVDPGAQGVIATLDAHERHDLELHAMPPPCERCVETIQKKASANSFVDLDTSANYRGCPV